MFGSKMLQDPDILAENKKMDKIRTNLTLVSECLDDIDIPQAINFYMAMIEVHILNNPDINKASKVARTLRKDVKSNSLFTSSEFSKYIIRNLEEAIEVALDNIISFYSYVEREYNDE